MTASDASVEIWLGTIGQSRELIERSLAAAGGQGSDGIAVSLLGDGVRDEGELRELADSSGVRLIKPAEIADAIEASRADILVYVRWGVLNAGAVADIRSYLARFPQVDAAYGDSLTENAVPLLRPMFSPLRLRSNDYLGPIVIVRRAVLAELGIRREAARAQVLDVTLRLHEAGRMISLIPATLATEELSHEDFAQTSSAQTDAVTAHLERCGVSADIEELKPFVRRIRYDIQGEPLVSIIIPTRGTAADVAGGHRVLVVEAIRGILENSTYRNVEFVVVADDVTPDEVIAELEELCGDRLVLAAWTEPFNFSAKINRGAAVANGEYLLLLNDDVEVVSPDWLESLLGLAQQEGVGIVGAQLYFEDSTIQHAGQIYTGGVAGHAAFGWPGGRDDTTDSLLVDHEVSGVTAACALIRRDLFTEVGGMTLALPGNYNDVDLNLKVRSTGRTAAFTPWARLYHFESKTRDPRILPTDLQTLQSRWLSRMQDEMYSRML